MGAEARQNQERTPSFDVVLVMGKELRTDPARAMRELRARAAAASAAWRAGASTIYTLEARLRGQDQSGSTILRALLAELGVPDRAIHQEDLTRSTREEIVRGAALFAEHGARRPLVLTARYHVARTRWHLVDLGVRATVQSPTGLWRLANPTERSWIAAGEPDDRVMAQEARVEALLSGAARALAPLPRELRSEIEVRAGALWRGDP